MESGYCKHGTWVGGIGADYLCGACEDGADYPVSRVLLSWQRQATDGGWTIIQIIEGWAETLIDRLAEIEYTDQGDPCRVGWVLKHGWSTEPSDLEDTVFDALLMARQEMVDYAVCKVDGSYVIMTLLMASVNGHDVHVIIRPDGEASWTHENRMIVKVRS